MTKEKTDEELIEYFNRGEQLGSIVELKRLYILQKTDEENKDPLGVEYKREGVFHSQIIKCSKFQDDHLNSKQIRGTHPDLVIFDDVKEEETQPKCDTCDLWEGMFGCELDGDARRSCQKRNFDDYVAIGDRRT